MNYLKYNYVFSLNYLRYNHLGNGIVQRKLSLNSRSNDFIHREGCCKVTHFYGIIQLGKWALNISCIPRKSAHR